MEAKNYIIALDMGTTGTRGILYRIEKGIEDMKSQNYPVYHPKPGFTEQDPDEVLRAVIQVVSSLITNNNVNPRHLSAMVFGGILHSLLPVDKNGKALTRAIIWADSRSITQSERLRAELQIEEIKRVTGCTIHPLYHLPRVLWFKEEAPDIFKKTYKFISIKEYIIYHLFGKFIIDRSVASGTGIWSMADLDWDRELLKILGIYEDRFSQVVETTSIIKGLKKEYALQMSLLEGIPCVIGASDGPLAHLGSVGLSDSAMSITVGSSAALRRRIENPMVLPGFEAWCYYMTENQWLLGGVAHDAGIVLKWFIENFMDGYKEDDVYALLNTYADEIPPGSEGLLFFPFFSGERTPKYNPKSKGSILELSFIHGKKHLVRAILEGISYRLHTIYNMLTFNKDMELVVTGGILSSQVWLGIVADFLGKRLWKPAIKEASAWGAVLIGLRALGVIDKLEKIDEYVRRNGFVDFNQKTHQSYKDILKVYEKYYSKIYQ